MLKSALTIALYSLSSSTHITSAFLPVTTRSLSPAITASFLVVRSSRAQQLSSSTSRSSSTLSNSSSNNDPHLQTHPLAPTSSLLSPTILQRIQLRLGLGKRLRERVVHKYFHGVDTKNIAQIAECFHSDGAIIRDICSLKNKDASYQDVANVVTPEFLGERCREFLVAHPDAKVMFHHGPTCGRGRNNNWVYAHWYEEGSWSGSSQGIEPDGSPLTVQGQTRFLVDDDLKIKEIVITRTFSAWEEMLLKVA